MTNNIKEFQNKNNSFEDLIVWQKAKDFTRFLYISLSSVAEAKTQLIIAKDIQILKNDSFKNFYDEI